jgi:hypothetical protein
MVSTMIHCSRGDTSMVLAMEDSGVRSLMVWFSWWTSLVDMFPPPLLSAQKTFFIYFHEIWNFVDAVPLITHGLSLGFFSPLVGLEVLSLDLVRDLICGSVNLME